MTAHAPISKGLVAETVRSGGGLSIGDDDVAVIPPGATADVFSVDVGGERFVAKYAYDDRAYFEGGLRASEVVHGWSVSTPVRTRDDALTAMIEWPPGHWHPVALLRFVEGDPVDDDRPDAPEVLGSVCGGVHAQLLALDPASVGVEVPAEVVGELLNEWDIGEELRWLDDLARELPARARELVAGGGLRLTVGVWDGPDIRIAEDGTVGLIDFGHTSWAPLVNVVANRSVVAAYEDASRLARFLGAVEASLPLTAAEHAALPVFRLYNAVIYARWAASRGEATTDSNRRWLARLVRFLESVG